MSAPSIGAIAWSDPGPSTISAPTTPSDGMEQRAE